MLLRETSLMPHIPGLPALLSVLFAPAMELRCGARRPLVRASRSEDLGGRAHPCAPSPGEETQNLGRACLGTMGAVAAGTRLQWARGELRSRGA